MRAKHFFAGLEKLGKTLLLLTLVFSVATACVSNKSSKSKSASANPSAAAAAAARAAAAKRKGGMKPYNKVITKEAKSDPGLFTVHKVGDKYYYEIPDSLLGREMLMVTRIAKTATNLGYGGEKTNTQVLRWQRKDKKIYLRIVSYSNTAADSLPVFQSVRNSNFEPIMMAFDIKALTKDSSGVVIETTSMFNSDVKAIGLDNGSRQRFRVSRLDKSRTYIEHVKSFPLNIEARHVLTYFASRPPSTSSNGAISLEMNQSMILLPKKPMMPRMFDQRVGWFTRSQTDFGLDEQKATDRSYLVRWRLEPKDPEAFARGELVEPVKQIVYYIDPATPEKWRPYLKQGVEDWQVAFEAAGFKNAIIAKDPPSKEEDPDWSPEDVRYSVIRYFASDVQNAYGPNVHDPRSGEILESDIGWYHNVMNLLRNWHFIQTAAVNPDARKTKFDDALMGELIRFVSAHEVGHTLGLPHNMGSSAAYPVDSLRSPSFTAKYNTAPSIMDYARFNYVAQPGDEGVNLFPGVGIYDKYSINWGYRPILEANTPEEEQETLRGWILEHEGDPMYRFGRQSFNAADPRSQTEDLGDDAMKASAYGISNLKIIMNNLVEWTTEEGEDFDDLQELFGQVAGQWNRYMGHVRANIGGVYETYKAAGQEGMVYECVPRDKQQRAMDFLIKECFNTPIWMVKPEILRRIEDAGMVNRIRGLQVSTLNNVLDFSRMARLMECETIDGSTYTLVEMMGDLRRGIFTELSRGRKIDMYRRNLQRAYIDRMQYLMTGNQPNVNGFLASFANFESINVNQSDIRAVTRAELKTLERQIKGALGRTSDTMTRYHLQDMLARIDKIFDPN